MIDVVEKVVDFLDAESNGLDAGVNLFSAPELSGNGVPKEAVFVQNAAGTAPRRTMADKLNVRTALVDIYVRSNNHLSGRQLALSIINSFTGQTPTDLEDAISADSEPDYLGRNDAGNDRWLVVIQAKYAVQI